MPEARRISELKNHAMKLLKEVDDEIRIKLSEIERLKLEVAELNLQKEVLQQASKNLEELESKIGPQPQPQPQPQPRADPMVASPITSEKPATEQSAAALKAEKPKAPSVASVQHQSPQETARETPGASASASISASEPLQPQSTSAGAEARQITLPKRNGSGDKKWESISVNNTEYAKYSLGKSTIDLEFNFSVPVDSKYVKGFILDKYLQKLKEDGMMRVKRGEIPPENCFGFDVKTNEEGEITAIYIANVATEQTQDLLNKIKWFVASEVRDLKAKGRVS